MRHKKLLLCAVFLLGLGLTQLRAQQATPASGGTFNGSGGSVSYSVGQIDYTTNIGTTGTVSQGVQQPIEIYVFTGIDVPGIDLSITAYPNPATNYLLLKVDGVMKGQYIASLVDINGKLIETKKVEDIETRFDMSNLVISTYFVKVIRSSSPQQLVKTFKIIKN